MKQYVFNSYKFKGKMKGYDKNRKNV